MDTSCHGVTLSHSCFLLCASLCCCCCSCLTQFYCLILMSAMMHHVSIVVVVVVSLIWVWIIIMMHHTSTDHIFAYWGLVGKIWFFSIGTKINDFEQPYCTFRTHFLDFCSFHFIACIFYQLKIFSATYLLCRVSLSPHLLNLRFGVVSHQHCALWNLRIYSAVMYVL